MRTIRTKAPELAVISVLAWAMWAPASGAEEAQPVSVPAEATADPETGTAAGSGAPDGADRGFGSAVADFLNGPGVPGPLSPLGEALHSAGFKPVLNLVGMDIHDLSMGETRGKHESLMLLTAGLDTDLQTLAGLHGSTVHFRYLYVPGPHDNGDLFGSYGGDSIVGNAGPFIPYVSHLTKFTWEQRLLDDRLDVEIGKSNAADSFAKPLCNQPFLCQGLSLQDSVGFAPPPYPNWSGRVAYDILPELTAQVGYWRYNTKFPFSRGWEGWSGTVDLPARFGSAHISHPNVGLYLGNLVYQTTYKTDSYPKYYELMLYHNDGEQTDPYTGATHKGTDGMYIGGRQTVWRERGDSGAPRPTAVSVYSSLYASFDDHQGVSSALGLKHELDTGVTLEAPFASRPFDSYSLRFLWHRLTDGEVSYLRAYNTNYTRGADEMAAGVDANFMLAGSVIFSPWALYVWNPNTLQATQNGVSYNGNPKSGFAVGGTVVVLLDKILGL